MPDETLELTDTNVLIRYPTGAPREHGAIERAAKIADAGEGILEAATGAVEDTKRDRNLTAQGVAEKRRELAQTAWDAVRRALDKAPDPEMVAGQAEKLLNPDRLLKYSSPNGEPKALDLEREAQTREELLRIREEEGEEAVLRTLRRAAQDGERVTLRAARNAAPIHALWPEEETGDLMEDLLQATAPDAFADLEAKRSAVSTVEFNRQMVAERLRELGGDPSIGRDDPVAEALEES